VCFHVLALEHPQALRRLTASVHSLNPIFPRLCPAIVLRGERTCRQGINPPRERVKPCAFGFLAFLQRPFCVTLTPMGSKDKGKKEPKKAPKPKPKPEPGRRREGFAPAPPK
jgi:hypothetical protein